MFFAGGGILMGLIWWAIGLGAFSRYLVITAILTGVGLVFGLVVASHYRFMLIGHLNTLD